ncbi:hypothetical protein C7R93_06235 [Brevibacillus fortis]|uniref:Uncharacterized protein n=1 Tax=Brevibacillus fortis TaxID=2126352 RepID=A0A2P7VH27_9BACL|nr:hypothetical protein C7R93_06235 [Brevibacillus fortis]
MSLKDKLNRFSKRETESNPVLSVSLVCFLIDKQCSINILEDDYVTYGRFDIPSHKNTWLYSFDQLKNVMRA